MDVTIFLAAKRILWVQIKEPEPGIKFVEV